MSEQKVVGMKYIQIPTPVRLIEAPVRKSWSRTAQNLAGFCCTGEAILENDPFCRVT